MIQYDQTHFYAEIWCLSMF